MSTGEGQDPRNGQGRRDGEERGGRGERIGVGGGDDSVSRIQLAARWAEAYGQDGDSLGSVLKRFRAAYDYLDAVIHGVEPPDLDTEATHARPTPTGTPTPSYAPPAQPSWSAPSQPESAPSPQPWAPRPPEPPAQPPSEPRPWG